MFGILLTALGTLLSEIGDLIGKAQARLGKEDGFAMAFFNNFWSAVIFLGILIFKWQFVFSLASLPTFALRAVLEILQTHFTVTAVIRADRSTFGFVRTLTLPLLLLVDFVLGYAVSARQAAGIMIIIAVMIFVFLSRKLDRRGLGAVLFTALNAVVTISLLKYDITHFNSVEAEQFLISAILLVYFWAASMYFARKNVLRQLFQSRIFLTQSLVVGLAGVAESFAYTFAPASIILAAKRSTATAWSVLSGHYMFAEKNFIFKIAALALLIAGIVLLIP